MATALLAAPGIALKHYFILVPLGLEIWLFARTRRFALRPEIAVLVLAALMYGAAIAILTPDYLSTMVPLIRLAYRGFDGDPLLLKLELLVLFLTWLTVKLRGGSVPLASQAAGVAAIGWLLAYLWQGKGFEYHLVPALGCSLAALFSILAESPLPRPALLAACGALAAALAIPVTAGASRHDQAAQRATANLPDGATILVLSPSGSTAWPLVEQRRFGWPSRHMTLWMLGAVWSDARNGGHSPQLQALGRSISAEAGVALACARPHQILVDTRFEHLAGAGGILEFFRRDPAFRSGLIGYAQRGDVAYLKVFERKRAQPRRPEPPLSCPPGGVRAEGWRDRGRA